MEYSDENVKLINWIPFVIYTYSFLRYVLESYEISCDNGFVLIADNEVQAREFREGYCRGTDGNGLKLNIKDYENASYNNYCAGLVNLTRQKLDECEEFLEETQFFPVLICGGILPKELRVNHYLFRISPETVEYVSSAQFHHDICEWRDYIISNIGIICKSFELTDGLIVMKKNINQVGYRNLFKMLSAIGEIYSQFLREKHDEEKAKLFKKRYTDNCVKRLKRIAQFADGLDLCELLTEAIWNYVKSDKILMLIAVTECDQNVLNCFEKNQALLYDEEYYYISEALMRMICVPMLNGFSWTELKEQMADANLIERCSSGYTMKKTILCEGITKRIRTIKLHKEFLLVNDRMEILEDYFKRQEEK